MKLTYRNKDYFYARLYETITDRFDEISTDELFTMHKELDERFRFGFKAEEVEKLVRFWIGCSFEDFIEISYEFNVDFSEEIGEFLQKYWLDLLQEIRKILAERI